MGSRPTGRKKRGLSVPQLRSVWAQSCQPEEAGGVCVWGQGGGGGSPQLPKSRVPGWGWPDCLSFDG